MSNDPSKGSGKPLHRGYIDKGGHNPRPSQITERPPGPKPIPSKPASGQQSGQQGRGGSQGGNKSE